MLYKHIIQVENENVGLNVCVCVGGGGHKHIIATPPNQKSGGHMPTLPTPRFLRQCIYRYYGQPSSLDPPLVLCILCNTQYVIPTQNLPCPLL